MRKLAYESVGVVVFAGFNKGNVRVGLECLKYTILGPYREDWKIARQPRAFVGWNSFYV